MSIATAEIVVARATELARNGTGADSAQGHADPAQQLLDAAGGDRRLIEVARDIVAGRVRYDVSDFESTATLRVLNRALSALPINDPLDWKVRWGQRFRRP